MESSSITACLSLDLWHPYYWLWSELLLPNSLYKLLYFAFETPSCLNPFADSNDFHGLHRTHCNDPSLFTNRYHGCLKSVSLSFIFAEEEKTSQGLIIYSPCLGSTCNLGPVISETWRLTVNIPHGKVPHSAKCSKKSTAPGYDAWGECKVT